MVKKDLKSGMVVRTNNNIYYMVLRDTGMEITDYSDKDVLLRIDQKGNIGHDGWLSLSAFNDNLEHEYNESENGDYKYSYCQTAYNGWRIGTGVGCFYPHDSV